MTFPINTSIACRCGTVKATIRSPSALRLVCHCVDCRGYYQELDKRAGLKLAPLTPYGGVDLIQIYPSELTIDSGKEQLALARIDPNYAGKKSTLPRVYAKCCNTPLYSAGMTVMVNAHLVPEADRGPIKYNIMGRMALQPEDEQALKNEKNHSNVASPPKNLTSSIPFSFPFVMMGRAARASSRKNPSPWEEQPEIDQAEVIRLKPYQKK